MAEPETPPPGEEQDDIDALETPEGAVNADDQVIDTTKEGGGSSAASATAATPAPKKGGLKQLLQRFNIYLLLFLFILVLAGGVLLVAYFQAKKATSTTVKTQDLTQSTLQQLAASDATIGSTQQVLNVQSSAVFAGRVLIRDGLEVAGSVKIGGPLVLNDLAVSGSGQFGQVQVSKNLSVTGDGAIQGSLTVAKSLQVSGGGSFSGPVSTPQLTTSSLQLNGDLVLTRHISAGGPSPSLSRGSALGSGGSASVSGSDTGGSVTINIGSGASAGCFATISFASKFSSTPRVLLTPVGSDGGSINYYVNRSSTSFSICDATAPPAGSSFGFDYFVFN